MTLAHFGGRRPDDARTAANSQDFSDGYDNIIDLINIILYIIQMKSAFNKIRKPRFGALTKAAFDGDIDSVRDLLKRRVDINEVNILSLSPLIAAAGEGHTEIARLLIAEGADIDKKASETPLTKAIMNRQADMVRLLVDSGADIYIRGMAGVDAVALAGQIGSPEIKEIMKEANERGQQRRAEERAAAAAVAEVAEAARIKRVTSPALLRDMKAPKVIQIPAHYK
jgi:ankyrin repeat protein